MKEFLDRSAKGNNDLAASNHALATEQRRSADALKRIAEPTKQQQEQSKGDRMETFLQKLDERFSILFRENKELMNESTDVEADVLLIFDRAIRNKSMMKFLDSNPVHTWRLIDILISVKDDSTPSKSEGRPAEPIQEASSGTARLLRCRVLFSRAALSRFVFRELRCCVWFFASCVVAFCFELRCRVFSRELVVASCVEASPDGEDDANARAMTGVGCGISSLLPLEP